MTAIFPTYSKVDVPDLTSTWICTNRTALSTRRRANFWVLSTAEFWRGTAQFGSDQNLFHNTGGELVGEPFVSAIV